MKAPAKVGDAGGHGPLDLRFSRPGCPTRSGEGAWPLADLEVLGALSTALPGWPATPERVAPNDPFPTGDGAHPSTSYFVGTLELGGHPIEVRADRADGGIRLAMESVGTFLLTTGPTRLREVSPPAERGALFRIALTGPLLLLPLATLGRFCLHASAVCSPDGPGVGILGASGAGKSTLARRLAGHGWKRAGDDLLVVATAPAGTSLLPHFPQPRLDDDEMRRILDLPARLPARALLFLRPAETGEVALRPLPDRATAVARLVEGTVACRLFDPRLLGSHLDACARIAETTPLFELDYPHRPESIGRVAELLDRL